MRLIRINVVVMEKGGAHNVHEECLINPDNITRVLIGKTADGMTRLTLYLSGDEGTYGHGGAVVTDPPSVDRILDLERTE